MLWDSTSSPSQTVISRQPIFASMLTSWLPTEPAPMTVTGWAAFGSKTSSCWEKLSVGCMGFLLVLRGLAGRGVGRAFRLLHLDLLHELERGGQEAVRGTARDGTVRGIGQ